MQSERTRFLQLGFPAVQRKDRSDLKTMPPSFSKSGLFLQCISDADIPFSTPIRTPSRRLGLAAAQRNSRSYGDKTCAFHCPLLEPLFGALQVSSSVHIPIDSASPQRNRKYFVSQQTSPCRLSKGDICSAAHNLFEATTMSAAPHGRLARL
jgi:hypothetical protein